MQCFRVREVTPLWMTVVSTLVNMLLLVAVLVFAVSAVADLVGHHWLAAVCDGAAGAFLFWLYCRD
jgi:hypothetical protein